MDRLLSAMAIFIEYPVLAVATGMLFLGLGRVTRRRVPSAVGVVWLLYAVYETGMKQRWLCSGECNIRIDLLVIYPVLLMITIVAGVSLVRASRRRRPLGAEAADRR